MIYNVNKLDKLVVELGRRGENLATTIEIDVSAWLALWPTASINVIVVRPDDGEAYVAKTSVMDGILSWPVTSVDTAKVGYGTFEVRAIADEVVKKSVTATTRVCPCISCDIGQDPPEEGSDWVNDVLGAAKRAEEAAERAEDIAEALAGGGGDVGADLFLPKVTEEDNGKVMTVVGGKWQAADPDKGVAFETDDTLKLENGILSVNRAEAVEEDNTLPITSAAVYAEVGNINALLETI